MNKHMQANLRCTEAAQHPVHEGTRTGMHNTTYGPCAPALPATERPPLMRRQRRGRTARPGRRPQSRARARCRGRCRTRAMPHGQDRPRPSPRRAGTPAQTQKLGSEGFKLAFMERPGHAAQALLQSLNFRVRGFENGTRNMLPGAITGAATLQRRTIHSRPFGST